MRSKTLSSCTPQLSYRFFTNFSKLMGAPNQPSRSSEFKIQDGRSSVSAAIDDVSSDFDVRARCCYKNALAGERGK